MREPTMKWFFEPRRDDDSAGRDRAGLDQAGRAHEDSAAGLVSLPAAMLHRHGARVLDPGRAVAVHGYPTPRSTVYRVRTLLVPGDLLADRAFIRAVNRVLERAGMHLIPVEPDRDIPDQAAPAQATPARDRADQAAADRGRYDGLRRLSRPAVLVPAEGNLLPVEVDAWTALQTLRAAATVPEQPELDETAVQRISLEHVLIGTSVGGSPIGHVGGGISGSPGSSSTDAGPSSTDSYLFSGGDARTPVAVFMDPPKRKPASECATEFGRRPVVAVLDTGLRVHPWLDVTAKPGGGYDTAAGGFTAVDDNIQDAIRVAGELAAATGDKHRKVIKHPWDTPVTADPLVGELGDATGHGTFIAGIVRQVVPDAQVLAVRVMHSDDVAYEGDILCALSELAARIANAEAGDPAAMVDVVSLSFGYFSESPKEMAFSFALWPAIEALLGMGVVVVAAAGNYSTSRFFYPAAFAAQPVPAGQVPVVSVGALNPNGSKAVFSDGGPWITAWATGAAVVSTFPTDINASRTPELRMRAHPDNEPREREALDPDDYSGGFAIWSGTSFSAPFLAAQVVRSLLEGAAGAVPGLRLDLPGQQAAVDRAVAALKNLDWPG
jgi:hypothetical protein